MLNMFTYFTKFEVGLWSCSCLSIIILYCFNPHRDVLTLIASLLGATLLIFLAKGHPAGQILSVVFALIYAYISYHFHYYGEMITYLFMTAPTAALAAIEWIRNPYQKGKSEVKVAPLTKIKLIGLFSFAIIVTGIFYLILKFLNTANLPLSTLSVTTSFLASSLTVLRSPYYALAYAANDIILIGLWILASVTDISYLPMVLCFVVFLINDFYGFINWKRIQKRQDT